MIYFKDKKGMVYAFEDGTDTDVIPAGLQEIDESEALALVNPPPTPEQVADAKTAVIQKHMDDAAKAAGYDDIKSAVTYADEPAVPKFQNEGKAFRAWRSLCWAEGYQIMAEVQTGTRPLPTDAELIAELPALVLPS